MKKTVIIEIRGGNVQYIGADTESVNVVIVDHDNLERADSEEINTSLEPQEPEQTNCKQFLESVRDAYFKDLEL